MDNNNDNIFKVPFLACCIAKRNSGKSFLTFLDSFPYFLICFFLYLYYNLYYYLLFRYLYIIIFFFYFLIYIFVYI